MAKLTGLTPMLKTDDMGDTVAFYTDVLGFTVDTLAPANVPTICFLDFGGVHVAFYVDIDRREASAMMTGQLYFDVDDVLGYHEKVAPKAEVLWGPAVYHYGRREFAVRDPNGYVLTFGEPTASPPDPE